MKLTCPFRRPSEGHLRASSKSWITYTEDLGSRLESAKAYALRKKASKDLCMEMDSSALANASSRWPVSYSIHPS